MDIGFYFALCFIDCETADGNFFSYYRGHIGDIIFNGCAVELASVESFHVCGFIFRNYFCNGVYYFVEFISAGNEVAFAVDFQKHARAAFFTYICADSAFGSDSALFFNCLCNAALSQKLGCFFHIAVCVGQSFFAIEHARPALFAEFHNVFSSECHNNILLLN